MDADTAEKWAGAKHTLPFSVDGRTRPAKEFKRRLAALLHDAGGEANLSYSQKALARRAILLELRLEGIDNRIALGEPEDMGKYALLVNCLHGLLKSLGIPKSSPDSLNIDDYTIRE